MGRADGGFDMLGVLGCVMSAGLMGLKFPWKSLLPQLLRANF